MNEQNSLTLGSSRLDLSRNTLSSTANRSQQQFFNFKIDTVNDQVYLKKVAKEEFERIKFNKTQQLFRQGSSMRTSLDKNKQVKREDEGEVVEEEEEDVSESLADSEGSGNMHKA